MVAAAGIAVGIDTLAETDTQVETDTRVETDTGAGTTRVGGAAPPCAAGRRPAIESGNTATLAAIGDDSRRP